MNDCRVSVIVPVYNCAGYLRQCFDPVLRQTLAPIELILVDDASTDGSRAIIDEYAARDARVRVVSLERNSGLPAARNAGIAVAGGDYVIFLDADDYWCRDDMLAYLVAAADEARADLVSFGFCRVDDAGNRSHVNVDSPRLFELPREGGWRLKYNVWAKIIARRLLEAPALRFDPTLTMGEDAPFSVALYCRAERLLVVGETFYCYRVNPTGITGSSWNRSKLFSTVRWFEGAIRVMRASPLGRQRPEKLQSIALERFRMLFTKLGPIALGTLTAPDQQVFFERWAACLQCLEPETLERYTRSNPAAGAYRELLWLLRSGEIGRLAAFFNGQEYRRAVAPTPSEVRLGMEQARRLGGDLLKRDEPVIHCDFGGGVVLALPRDLAHRLAHQFIANRNPEITLKLN